MLGEGNFHQSALPVIYVVQIPLPVRGLSQHVSGDPAKNSVELVICGVSLA